MTTKTPQSYKNMWPGDHLHALFTTTTPGFFYWCASDLSVIKMAIMARPPPSTSVWLTYGSGDNADKVP